MSAAPERPSSTATPSKPVYTPVLGHSEEPWIGRPSRSDHSILILRNPVNTSNDVIACVMHHRDGTTEANARLFLAAPRLLRLLSELHAACQPIDLRGVIAGSPLERFVAARREAGELLAELEVRP